jgi:hypothetical protein
MRTGLPRVRSEIHSFKTPMKKMLNVFGQNIIEGNILPDFQLQLNNKVITVENLACIYHYVIKSRQEYLGKYQMRLHQGRNVRGWQQYETVNKNATRTTDYMIKYFLYHPYGKQEDIQYHLQKIHERFNIINREKLSLTNNNTDSNIIKNIPNIIRNQIENEEEDENDWETVIDDNE